MIKRAHANVLTLVGVLFNLLALSLLTDVSSRLAFYAGRNGC